MDTGSLANYFLASQQLQREREWAKDDLLETLRECAAMGDAEVAHAKADQALLAYIDDEEICTAYEAIERWYA